MREQLLIVALDEKADGMGYAAFSLFGIVPHPQMFYNDGFLSYPPSSRSSSK